MRAQNIFRITFQLTQLERYYLEKVADNFIAGNNFDKSRSIFPIQANKFLYIINSASTNLQIPLSGKMSSIVTEITEE